MSNQTLSTSLVEIGGFTLSVTTRNVGDNLGVMEELTFRTIGAWLHLVGKIQRQEFELAETEQGSVEGRYLTAVQKDFPDAKLADAWGDARVTIWNKTRDRGELGFHLNSDDDFQAAVDTWRAHQRAIERAAEYFKPKDRQTETAQPAPANQAPATPKGNQRPAQSPTASANGDAPLHTKKEALSKLQPGGVFRMKIVQIEKHSKDGLDFYEFFEPYGGKAGQYSSASVFVDNEIAVNNGLIAFLDSLGIKPGQALTGNWVAQCSVGKPKTKTIKGEEKTFTNIFINRFEGQPEPV